MASLSSGGCWQSLAFLAWKCIILISASIIMMFSLCVCLYLCFLFLQRHRLYWIRTHSNQYRTQLHLQRPYFKLRLYSQRVGVKTSATCWYTEPESIVGRQDYPCSWVGAVTFTSRKNWVLASTDDLNLGTSSLGLRAAQILDIWFTLLVKLSGQAVQEMRALSIEWGLYLWINFWCEQAPNLQSENLTSVFSNAHQLSNLLTWLTNILSPQFTFLQSGI